MVATLVNLDEDVFARLREMALADHTSFAEAVRTVLTWGFDSVDQPEDAVFSTTGYSRARQKMCQYILPRLDDTVISEIYKQLKQSESKIRKAERGTL